MIKQILKFSKSYTQGTATLPKLYCSIGDRMNYIAHKFPDNLALVSHHQNKSFTYQELLTQCQHLAAALRDLGLQKNERVGIYSPNNYQWTIT